jgi:hypothetical protein
MAAEGDGIYDAPHPGQKELMEDVEGRFDGRRGASQPLRPSAGDLAVVNSRNSLVETCA